MYIPIYYNEEIDEFSNDLFIEDRIDNYINRHFYIIKTIAALAEVYLVGGSIRDLIFAKKPKDLDFVVLNNNNMEWIIEVLNKYNIEYRTNRLGGLKLNFNDVEVDIWTSNDLFSSIQYNVDGLLFNVNRGELLSLTFDDFTKNGIREVNENNNINNGRIEKLKVFEKKYLNKKYKDRFPYLF